MEETTEGCRQEEVILDGFEGFESIGAVEHVSILERRDEESLE